jgi:predicted ATP-grasp superfamily ATP-dependent carboligase
MAIAKHKDKLEQVSIPCVGDWKTLEILIDKTKFNMWCDKHGYPVPHAWLATQAEKIPLDSYPIIAKPISRRSSADDSSAKKKSHEFDQNRVRMVNNQYELSQLKEKIIEFDKLYFLQEYIPGMSDTMYTVGIYANKQGIVKGVFSGRKLRGFPADVGDWRLGQVEAMPNEIISIVEDFCHRIGYHGIAEFEFKRDPRDGKFWLIEVNPRSWSWVGITSYCQVSLPWMAYADCSGLENIEYKRIQIPDGSVKIVRLLDDFINCLFVYRLNGFPEWSLSFKQWKESLESEKLVTAEFAKDDFLPGLVSFLELLIKVVLTLVMFFRQFTNTKKK